MALMDSLFAQQITQLNQREIYISSLAISTGNFGLQYKSSINESTFFRLALLSINTGFESFTPVVTNEFSNSDFEINGGLEVGLEKRSSITERMKIFYGGL